MNDKKMYSVKELADILGCSVTAVQKKITADADNVNIKHYRNRYDAVINDGRTVILLTDEELEAEKRLSKGFKNININAAETSDDVIDIELESKNQSVKYETVDKLIKFTESYIDRFETLQNRYYNLLSEKDKQVKLLTDSESETQKKYFEAQAKTQELEEKNKNITAQNTLLIRLLMFAAAVIISLVTLCFFVSKTV